MIEATDICNAICICYNKRMSTVISISLTSGHHLRFEFYEGIVRASFGKYIASGIMTDASNATEAFIKEVRRGGVNDQRSSWSSHLCTSFACLHA